MSFAYDYRLVGSGVASIIESACCWKAKRQGKRPWSLHLEASVCLLFYFYTVNEDHILHIKCYNESFFLCKFWQNEWNGSQWRCPIFKVSGCKLCT